MHGFLFISLYSLIRVSHDAGAAGDLAGGLGSVGVAIPAARRAPRWTPARPPRVPQKPETHGPRSSTGHGASWDRECGDYPNT